MPTYFLTILDCFIYTIYAIGSKTVFCCQNNLFPKVPNQKKSKNRIRNKNRYVSRTRAVIICPVEC